MAYERPVTVHYGGQEIPVRDWPFVGDEFVFTLPALGNRGAYDLYNVPSDSPVPESLGRFVVEVPEEVNLR